MNSTETRANKKSLILFKKVLDYLSNGCYIKNIRRKRYENKHSTSPCGSNEYRLLLGPRSCNTVSCVRPTPTGTASSGNHARLGIYSVALRLC